MRINQHDSDKFIKFSITRSGQSALEYMMTYGWAILIIVIVAVILYSMGIFSPASSISSTITGFSATPVSNAICTANGVLRIAVGDTTGHRILIKNISATSNGKTEVFTPSSTVDPNPIITSGNTYIFSVPNVCPAVGTHFSASVNINYTEPTTSFPTSRYTSTGSVTGTVSTTVLPSQAAVFVQSNNTASYFSASVPNSFSNGVTVSFWIDPINNGRWGVYGNYWEDAVSYGSCGGPFYFFIEAGQNPPMESWSVVNSTGYNFREFPSINLHANEFQQLVGTWDGNHLAVYLNGNLIGTNVSTTGPIVPSVNQLYMSGTSSLSSPACNALSNNLADVQIYNNISLTTAQIKALYSAGINGGPVISNKDLIGWWPINATVNNQAKDYSGNGYNAQLTNVQITSNYPS
jgi:hypothetical protein